MSDDEQQQVSDPRRPRRLGLQSSKRQHVEPSATPMNNSDFRKMMSTPAHPSLSRMTNMPPPSSSSSSSKPQHSDDDAKKIDIDAVAKKQRKGGARYEAYKKWQAKKVAEQEEKDSKYRDRATERRTNTLNPDYQSFDAEGEEYKALTADQTKYLGGDIEHTHLVKGLDFALLSKVRDELDRKEESQFEQAEKEGKSTNKPATATATSTRSAAKKKVDDDDDDDEGDKNTAAKEEAIRFVTPLGRAIHRLVISTNRPPLDTFLPGRMHFDFDLDPDFSRELPTTLIHSKEDCPPVEDRMSGALPTELSRKVTKVMSYLNQSDAYNGKGKGKRVTSTATTTTGTTSNNTNTATTSNGNQQQTDFNTRSGDELRAAAAASLASNDVGPAPGPQRPPLPDDDNDDIFGDAGHDYVPTSADAKTSAMAAAAAAAAGPPGGPSPSRSIIDVFGSTRTKSSDMMDTKNDDNGAAAAPGAARPPANYYGDDDEEDDDPFSSGLPKPGASRGTTPPAKSSGQPSSSSGGSRSGSGMNVGKLAADAAAAASSLLARAAATSAKNSNTASAAATGGSSSSSSNTSSRLSKLTPEQREKRRREIQREIETGGSSVPDVYSEAYPEFHSTATSLSLDGDEEADYSRMEQGKKKEKKGPWDFRTPEEWAKYNDDKEALPKAAFQYGVKMKDGRKQKLGGGSGSGSGGATPSRKNKGGSSSGSGGGGGEDAKLDKQWKQIQDIMSKRSGGATPARSSSSSSSSGDSGDRLSKRQRILGGF